MEDYGGGEVDYYAAGDGESYEDFYYDDDDQQIIPVREEATISELYAECLEPTFVTALNQVIVLLCSCLLFRILSQILPSTRHLSHLISLLCGILGLYGVIGPRVIFTTMFGISSYVFPILSERKILGSGSHKYVTLFLLIYLVFREYVPIIPEAWNEVRGVQMIMVLKILSLSLDLGSGRLERAPQFLDYLGYIFCPGTVVFGPWISFDVYCRIFETRNWNFRWVIKVFATTLSSFLCLGVSSCMVYWIFLGIHSSWILAIRSAYSVRFSHYFISFLSELTALLSGYDHIVVAEPWHIEFPRSLLDVVVFWNKPMHTWLKIYIFRPASHLGTLKAVLLTFLVSSTLHGMNFGLTMVLLSLGFYTYVEHNLRDKLALVFNACLRSRSCHNNCKHEFKSHNVIVILVNFIFGLWAFFHLSYLGVMLDKTHSEDLQGESQSVLQSIYQDWAKWKDLNFISHWTMLAVYLGSIVI